jgi:hypothetical protein
MRVSRKRECADVQEERMAANIRGQIAKLHTLPRQRLLDLWRKLYGRAAPPGIRRELMVPFLAYRMQAASI